MSDNQTKPAADNASANTIRFNVQHVYLKDVSLEQPNSPGILLEQDKPQIDINYNIEQGLTAENVYEVALAVTAHTKVKDKTLFLIEAKYAGIFAIQNASEAQLGELLNVHCPQLLFPYLRAIISDISTRAGFPAVLLSEMNFHAAYQMQQQEQGQKQDEKQSSDAPKQ